MYKVNYDRVGMALASGARISDLSPYAQFTIQCLGYRFYDRNGNELDKWEMYEMGYDNIAKLFNNQYPIRIEKR